LRDLFRRLSPQSQQRRFLAPLDDLDDLDDAMIQRLVGDVDGVHHIALPRVVLPPDGPERPAGVARLTQDPPARPPLRSPSPLPTNEWQGRGTGTALVQALLQRRPPPVRRLRAAVDACKPAYACAGQARKQNWLICGLEDDHQRSRVAANIRRSRTYLRLPSSPALRAGRDVL
jgi:hypothetical protein